MNKEKNITFIFLLFVFKFANAQDQCLDFGMRVSIQPEIFIKYESANYFHSKISSNYSVAFLTETMPSSLDYYFNSGGKVNLEYIYRPAFVFNYGNNIYIKEAKSGESISGFYLNYRFSSRWQALPKLYTYDKAFEYINDLNEKKYSVRPALSVSLGYKSSSSHDFYWGASLGYEYALRQRYNPKSNDSKSLLFESLHNEVYDRNYFPLVLNYSIGYRW
jgi:hypothetical protein